MNSFPRFQINLAEEFPRLHHAPIVESVLQINAPPLKPFQQSELKDLLSKRFEGYVVHDQMQLETGFRGSPGGNVESITNRNGTATAFIPKTKSISANGKEAVLFSAVCILTRLGTTS